MRTRLVLPLALFVVAAAACSPPAMLGLDEVAAGADAPPGDARLADAGATEVAAWITEEIGRSGRPVIVKFFASWCGPCEEEMPVLLDAAAVHPEVAVVGVAHQDRRDHAEAWVAEHGVDAIPTLFDIEGTTARRFGARGMPSVSFVDTSGALVHTHTGPIDSALLEDWIAHLTGDAPRPSNRPDAPAPDQPA